MNKSIGMKRSFNIYVTNKWRRRETTPRIEAINWIKILLEIIKYKANYGYSIGEKIINTHKMATNKNKAATVNICIWK